LNGSVNIISRLVPVHNFYEAVYNKVLVQRVSETQTRDPPVTDPPSIHFVVSLALVLFPLL